MKPFENYFRAFFLLMTKWRSNKDISGIVINIISIIDVAVLKKEVADVNVKKKYL